MPVGSHASLKTQDIANGVAGGGFEAIFLVGQLASLSGNRNFAEGFGEAAYRLNANRRLGIGQSVKKLYEYAEYAGEQEIVFADTQLLRKHSPATCES